MGCFAGSVMSTTPYVTPAEPCAIAPNESQQTKDGVHQMKSLAKDKIVILKFL